MKEQYSYYTKFNIRDEASIDDFWSYAVFRLNIDKHKVLYEQFSRLYNVLLDSKHTLSIKVTLFIYETTDDFLVKLKTPNLHVQEKLIRFFNEDKYTYELTKKHLSYKIDKRHVSSLNEGKGITKKVFSRSPKETLIVPLLQVYDFLSQDDKDDILNIIEKMQERNYDEQSSMLSYYEINDYKSAFSSFSSLAINYKELGVISTVFAELSGVLSLYSEECIQKAVEVRSFLQGFINALDAWFEQLFVFGCYGSNSMDASFSADLAQFKMLLSLYDEVQEGAECSLEDIFDF